MKTKNEHEMITSIVLVVDIIGIGIGHPYRSANSWLSFRALATALKVRIGKRLAAPVRRSRYPTVANRWWPQAAKQEGDTISQKVCLYVVMFMEKTYLRASLLDVSLLGVGTVFRLEKGCEVSGRMSKASNKYGRLSKASNK